LAYTYKSFIDIRN